MYACLLLIHALVARVQNSMRQENTAICRKTRYQILWCNLGPFAWLMVTQVVWLQEFSVLGVQGGRSAEHVLLDRELSRTLRKCG